MSPKPTYEELERKVVALQKTELQLSRTEAILSDEIRWRRLLIEQSRDPIVVLDQNAKVYDANSRFADMLGYSKEEVFELHVWDWDALHGKEQVLELARTVDADGHNFETKHRRKDGRIIDVELSNNGATHNGKKLILCICRDITERKRAEEEREKLVLELKEALAQIKTLHGILNICSYCHRIRNDEGEWEQMELYIRHRSEAEFSHGMCPECFARELSRIPPEK